MRQNIVPRTTGPRRGVDEDHKPDHSGGARRAAHPPTTARRPEPSPGAGPDRHPGPGRRCHPAGSPLFRSVATSTQAVVKPSPHPHPGGGDGLQDGAPLQPVFGQRDTRCSRALCRQGELDRENGHVPWATRRAREVPGDLGLAGGCHGVPPADHPRAVRPVSGVPVQAHPWRLLPAPPERPLCSAAPLRTACTAGPERTAATATRSPAQGHRVR